MPEKRLRGRAKRCNAAERLHGVGRDLRDSAFCLDKDDVLAIWIRAKPFGRGDVFFAGDASECGGPAPSFDSLMVLRALSLFCWRQIITGMTVRAVRG